MHKTCLTLLALPLTCPILSAAPLLDDSLEFTPGVLLSDSGATPGAGAAKAKLVRLTKTSGGAKDGRLVVVFADSNNTEFIWEPRGGERHPRDVFARYSDDEGLTWSAPVNISRTAGSYSSSTDWDGDGSPEPYWGDSEKPNIFSSGDRIVVSWIDKYCPQAAWSFGDSGQSAVQGSTEYVDASTFPNPREVPFAGVWVAVSADGGTTWTYGVEQPAIQLTHGRRDAKQDVNRGSGSKWVVTWQEDPDGLQLGEADGPGDGASGATTSKGTDIWYTYTADIVDQARSLYSNRVPLSNHSAYEVTSADGFPTVGSPGQLENHSASRANLFLLNDGGTFRGMVAYEETKGLPDLYEGKTVQYHSFPYDAPPVMGTSDATTGAAGTTLSDIAENARRVRFVAQSPDGVNPAIAMIWRQGTQTEGGSADIVLKTSTAVDEASLLAAPLRNLSTNTPSATTADLALGTTVDPLEDARAHRAYLRGSLLAVGYTYTWNGPLARYTDLANYDFWIRRSLDGGATWLAPQNLSNLPSTTVNVKEPRLVGPARTGAQDDAAFVVAWGTETNVYEGLAEPQPLDIQVSRTFDQGQTFAPVTDLTATLAGEFESQLRLDDSVREVYAVWMEERGGQSDTYFATGTDPNPLQVVLGQPTATPGAILPLSFEAPGWAGSLLVAGASESFAPGVSVGPGLSLPLMPDALFQAVVDDPSTFINFYGLVGPGENLPAAIIVPDSPSLVGYRFYLAFAVVDGGGGTAAVSGAKLVEVD